MFPIGRRRELAAVAAGALVLIAACEGALAPTPTPKPRPTPLLGARIDAPVKDTVMGSLSPLARHLAIGLRDPKARVALADYMKSNPNPRAGVDLQLCDRAPALSGIIAAGQRGGGSASMCGFVKAQAGVTLYMDPDRLRGWDASVAPIVTAIENPGAARPALFQGYRASDRMIDLPSDGSLGGPILVVLGQAHVSRRSVSGPRPTAARAIVKQGGADSAATKRQ